MERILLPTLSEALPPAPFQHGFRKGHSSVTALANLSNDTMTAFNENKPVTRTVVAAIDLTKAFDSIDRDRLLTVLQDYSVGTCTL